MWCGSIDADVRTIHWCLEFSRFIFLLSRSLLFDSNFVFLECETSRLLCGSPWYIHIICMMFPSFYGIAYSYGFHIHTYIYIHSSRGFCYNNNNIICKQFLWANDSNFFFLSTHSPLSATLFVSIYCKCIVHIIITKSFWIESNFYVVEWSEREKEGHTHTHNERQGEKLHFTIIDLFPGLL